MYALSAATSEHRKSHYLPASSAGESLSASVQLSRSLLTDTHNQGHTASHKKNKTKSAPDSSVCGVSEDKLFTLAYETRTQPALDEKLLSTTFGNKRCCLKRLFKGIVCSEMKSLSSFLHPHVVPNHYVGHKRRCFRWCSIFLSYSMRVERFWKHHKSGSNIQVFIRYLLKTLPWLSRIRATVTIHIQCMKKAAWTLHKIPPFVSRIRQNEGFKTKGEQLMRVYLQKNNVNIVVNVLFFRHLIACYWNFSNMQLSVWKTLNCYLNLKHFKRDILVQNKYLVLLNIYIYIYIYTIILNTYFAQGYPF